jgi:hypothetical protein
VILAPKFLGSLSLSLFAFIIYMFVAFIYCLCLPCIRECCGRVVRYGFPGASVRRVPVFLCGIARQVLLDHFVPISLVYSVELDCMLGASAVQNLC